jgi:tetratricopeptide (TPR) repeat protein
LSALNFEKTKHIAIVIYIDKPHLFSYLFKPKVYFTAYRINPKELKMKSWHLSRSLFLAVVGALLLNNGKGVSISPCHVADSLRDAQQYDIALAQYTDLLKKEPHCATKGIDEIIKIRAAAFQKYEKGKAFEAAADLKASEAAYIQALKINPTYKEAQQALQRVLQQPKSENQKESDIILGLANRGFYPEATERLKKIIETNPKAEELKELEHLAGGKIPEWRYFRHQFFAWYVLPGIEIAVALLIIIYLLRLLQDLYKPRLDIEDFEKGATALEIGKGLSAMIEEQYKNLGFQGGILSPQLVAGSPGNIGNPIDIQSLMPTKQILSVFARILPSILSSLPFFSKKYTLSGWIQSPSVRGVGLTLCLKKQTGEIVANCTIWQKDYEPTMNAELADCQQLESYYCLAEPAAIWAYFTIQEKTKKLKIESNRSIINNWQSYAFFRAGVYWRLHNENEKARIMFVEAIERDQNNHFALCNLGTINLESRNYERAIECLKQAVSLARYFKKVNKENIFKDSVWYKAKYQLAATYLYQGELWKARHQACRLNREIDKANEYLKQQAKEIINRIPKRKEDKLPDFLNSFKPMALILYADILARSKHLPRLKDIEKAKKIVKDIKEDIEKKPIPCRAHYNLACYYSGWGEYEQALRHLEYAFEPKDEFLLEWARKDPSLEGVRAYKNEKGEFKFEKLLKKYELKIKNSNVERDNKS